MDVRGAPLPLMPATDSSPRTAALRAPDPTRENPEIRRVAEEFESVFLAEMLAPMFENLDTEGLGGGGMGERMFRPMLVEQYAAAISKAGGVGIADQIVRELTRLQTVDAETYSAEAADGAAR